MAKINITEELSLEQGFDWRIENTRTCVEVIFTDEKGNKHSREFEIDVLHTTAQIEAQMNVKDWSTEGFMQSTKSTRSAKANVIVGDTEEKSVGSVSCNCNCKCNRYCCKFINFVTSQLKRLRIK